MSAEKTSSLLGQTILGRYRVKQQIGSGGMGEVYLAEDLVAGGDVVLKSPHSGLLLLDPQLRQRFLREIREMRKLDHTHIVKIYDVLELDERPIAIMQHLGGGSLDQCRHSSLQRWLPSIAGALDYMHARRKVHRDVKPANIFFDAQGTAYLGDFGIVKSLDGTMTSYTADGFTPGTPKYMSPEAVRGMDLDGRADQYSLAIVVYESLAGRIPFNVDADSTYQLMNAHAEVRPLPLSEIDTRYSAATSAVLDRALSKRPDERFASCGEFAAAVIESLKQVTQHGPDPVVADPVELPVGVPPFAIPPERRSASAPAARGWRSSLAARPGLVTAIAAVPYLVAGLMLLIVAWQGRNEPVAKHEVPAESTGETGVGSGVEVASPDRSSHSTQETDKPNSRLSGSGAMAVKGTNSSRAQKADDSWRATADGASNMNPPRQPDASADKPVNTGPSADTTATSGKSAAKKREPDLATAPFGASQAKEYQRQWAAYLGISPKLTVKLDSSTDLKFVLIPPGEFLMGSPDGEEDRESDEGPQHRVRITKPFYLGECEVTQGQFDALMHTRPWSGKRYAKEGSVCAASYVSWNDAAEFCQRLSQKEGRTYRLPTEAEWEYACRAGTTTAYHFGSDSSSLGDYGWYDGNADSKNEQYAHEVSQKKPNSWGLHDMLGNVRELCSDWYESGYYGASPQDDSAGPPSGSHRVARGGSWLFGARFCRSAYRSGHSPDSRYSDRGFRVALVPAE